MELPRRASHDVYLPPGSYTRLTHELQQTRTGKEWSTVLVYPFDSRTRLMPFRWVDQRVVPCGVRSVAASLLECGFLNTRIVLQQWNPNFQPSAAVRAGFPIDLLMVSTMGLHSEKAYELIQDAHSLGEQRPLILAGGPKAIYEPEDFFAPRPDLLGDGADVACTGEQYVLLELMQLLATHAAPGESPRTVFERVRQEGLLNLIPGLVYKAPEHPPGKPYVLNTGVQRLLQDLDELPMPLAGYTVIEPPHRGKTLSARPLRADKVRRHSFLSTLVITHGCRFNCEYCPIPAYQQRTWRHKSPERITAEIKQLGEQLGYRHFFGTDDNFFNNRASVEAIFTEMAKGTIHGKPFRDAIRFTTEATEFDVYKNRDLLPLAREAGLYTIFFGIEDLNAQLINKGQTVGKTEDLFRVLRENEIEAYSMMIHHDDQPFWSRRGEQLGVVNQARELFRLGAVGYQTTYICPSPGARNIEQMLEKGDVFSHLGDRKVPEAYMDGNHVIASRHDNAWLRQMHLWGAYLAFYNPWHLLKTMCTDLRNRHNRRRLKWQILGLSMLPASILKSIPFTLSLAFQKITRHKTLPARPVPMLDAHTGQPMSWAFDGPAPYAVTHTPRLRTPATTLPPVEPLLLPVVPFASDTPSCHHAEQQVA